MAKDDEIDLRVGRGACGFQGCLAVMAVQEEHDPRPNPDPDTIWQRLDEVKWVRIPTYGFNPRNPFQILNHRKVTNITGMQNQANASASKEIEHRIEGPTARCRGHMGVTKDANEHGRRNLGGALFNGQRSSPDASAHRDPRHPARRM
jgi:hypothetical protein